MIVIIFVTIIIDMIAVIINFRSNNTNKRRNRNYNMQIPTTTVWQQRKEFFFSKFMNLQRTLALPTSESSGTWVLGNLLGVSGEQGKLFHRDCIIGTIFR